MFCNQDDQYKNVHSPGTCCDQRRRACPPRYRWTQPVNKNILKIILNLKNTKRLSLKVFLRQTCRANFICMSVDIFW